MNTDTTATQDACDHGEDKRQTCYRLDIGGSGGVFLCRQHWHAEMVWRRNQNVELAPDCRYDILPWPGDSANKQNNDTRYGYTYPKA